MLRKPIQVTRLGADAIRLVDTERVFELTQRPGMEVHLVGVILTNLGNVCAEIFAGGGQQPTIIEIETLPVETYLAHKRAENLPVTRDLADEMKIISQNLSTLRGRIMTGPRSRVDSRTHGFEEFYGTNSSGRSR